MKESLSIREVLLKIGSGLGAGNYKTYKKYVLFYGIDTAHFTGQGSNTGKRFKPFCKKFQLEEILVKDSTYTNSSNLRERLIKEGLKKRKCENCGISDWLGQKLSLHLDHINGDNLDHRLENLRILCPNCHTQTNTHSGKRFKKVELCGCGKKKWKNSKSCVDCFSKNTKVRSKVERPDYLLLIETVKTIGYKATGRMYGVTDNTIRKWIKHYEKYSLLVQN